MMHTEQTAAGGRIARAIAVCAAVALAMLVIAACGGDDNGGGGGGASTDGGGGSDLKVAGILVGTANDQSFSEAFVNGLEKADQELGLSEVRTVGPVENRDEMLQQAGAFAEQGFQLVFLINGTFADITPILAERYLDTTFCGILQPTEEQLASEPENTCYFDPEQQFGSFMAGVISGLVTETDHVGAVAALDFPLLTRQPEAFQLGARCVNPDVEYSEAYTGSFVDAAAARSAAAGLYQGGADILLAAVDQAVKGVYSVAQEAEGRYVIPQYFDAYEQAPEVILTSVDFGLDTMAFDMVRDKVQDSLQRFYHPTDRWELAPFRDKESVIGEENLATYNEISEKVLSGEIEVPDETLGETPIGKRGSAKSIDPKDIGC